MLRTPVILLLAMACTSVVDLAGFRTNRHKEPAAGHKRVAAPIIFEQPRATGDQRNNADQS
jgi:hypothetical protein